MGVEDAIEIEDAGQFDTWLERHGREERECWVVIYSKASRQQTVGFDALLEVAITRGWIDVQAKRVDDLRYSIRFAPRKPGSNWSVTNRGIVKRLLIDGRMKPEGTASSPRTSTSQTPRRSPVFPRRTSRHCEHTPPSFRRQEESGSTNRGPSAEPDPSLRSG